MAGNEASRFPSALETAGISTIFCIPMPFSETNTSPVLPTQAKGVDRTFMNSWQNPQLCFLEDSVLILKIEIWSKNSASYLQYSIFACLNGVSRTKFSIQQRHNCIQQAGTKLAIPLRMKIPQKILQNSLPRGNATSMAQNTQGLYGNSKFLTGILHVELEQ